VYSCAPAHHVISCHENHIDDVPKRHPWIQYEVENLNGRTLSSRASIGALSAVDGTLVSYHLFLHFLLRCGSPFQCNQASVIKGFLISGNPQQILFFLSVFLLCFDHIIYFFQYSQIFKRVKHKLIPEMGVRWLKFCLTACAHLGPLSSTDLFAQA
jgi:hypothetical protein